MSTYSKHGFIAAVYGEWLSYEGSKWGDQLRAIHQAYEMGPDYAGLTDEQLDRLEEMLRFHLNIAHHEGILTGEHVCEGGENPYYLRCAEEALKAFPRIAEAWKAPGDSKSYEEALALIPDWMKSSVLFTAP